MTLRPGARAALSAAGIAAVTGLLLYGFLAAESEKTVALVLAGGVIAVAAGLRSGVLPRLVRAAGPRAVLIALGVVAVALVVVFHDDPFVLLLMARALLILVACLGLHVQLADAGVPNFAGAAFFGVGGYTAAVLARGALPHPLVLLASGAVAAAVGSLLLLPLLRTRGHYAALITIAFGLLFRTFLEVNETLGGPQGLKLGGLQIFGWSFNDDRRLLGLDFSGLRLLLPRGHCPGAGRGPARPGAWSARGWGWRWTRSGSTRRPRPASGSRSGAGRSPRSPWATRSSAWPADCRR